MKFTSCLRALAVVVTIASLISCGSGSSSNPTPQEVRAALVLALGEDNAFTGLIKAFVKGYSLQQIVDASLAGRLQITGDLQAADSSIIAPDLAPVGTLRNLRISAAPIQVEIESRIATVSQSYLEQIGLDLDLDALTVPLILSEEGYSSTQIVDVTNRTDRLIRGLGERPIVLVDGVGTPVESTLNRLNVLDLSGIEILTSPSPIPTEPGGSAALPTFSVSPTSAAFEHHVGVTSCPQLVTTLHITNTGDGAIQLQFTPDVSQLDVSNSSLILNANQSGNIDVNFNCSSAQSFTGHIPVIGRLFQNGQAVGDEVTTIVLITPTIINDQE